MSTPFAAPRAPLPPLALRARAARLVLVVGLTLAVVAVWDESREPTLVPALANVRFEQGASGGGDALPSAVATAEGQALDLQPAPNVIPGLPDPPEPTRPDRFERFVVQRGDTLFDISVVYGVAIEEILRFNPDLGDGSRVDVGQVVLIPIHE